MGVHRLALLHGRRKVDLSEGDPDAYVCWTINRAREMRYLRRLGVSGILTDFPARLRHLHTRQGYQEARRLARHARQHARRSRQVTEGHVRS